jgi:exopolysaccharide biosynthesis polyprenyl glycosylphosphotransferase
MQYIVCLIGVDCQLDSPAVVWYSLCMNETVRRARKKASGRWLGNAPRGAMAQGLWEAILINILNVCASCSEMKHYLFSFIKRKQYIVAVGDVIVVLSSLLLSGALARGHMPLIVYTMAAVVVVLCQLIIFHVYELYDLYYLYKVKKWDKVKRTINALSLIILCNLCFLEFVNVYAYNSIKLYNSFLYIVMNCMLIIAWRYVVGEYLLKTWKSICLAVIAPEGIVASLVSEMSNISLISLSSHILFPMDNSKNESQHYQNADPGKVNRIADFLRKRNFDILAFYSSNGFLANDEIEEILRLPPEGKQVYEIFNLYENLTGKVPLRMIDGQWLLTRSEFQNTATRTYGTIKRLLDMVVSALALAFLAPLMLLIGVAVKAGSRGPVFFAQERLGQDLKPFACYKFRTMIDGAEDNSGPVWASHDDPRVTTVGRFLRKSRLDELPQLWNVLKGDMTLVGPRPIRESYARELGLQIPFYRLRFCVRPGLTGWAQVNHDYAGSIEGQFEKFQYELFYVKNISLVLDLFILFKTIKTVIRQRGT